VDELRRVAEADWALLRDVRLRALTDAPTAFGATAAASHEQPDADWRERAGGPFPTLVVVDGSGAGVAMGGVARLPGADTAAEPPAWVWGMWTDPAARGRGHGTRVLDALLAWSRERALATYLHVTEGNGTALALYASRGFEPTGVRVPLRPGSSTYAAEMRLAPPG